MATRSRIGLLLDTEHVLSVYHHWDGYPSWLGVFLQKNYTTKEQIAELIDGGDISCIESEQTWNNDPCQPYVQYYNLRGEKTEPRLDLNVEDYLENEYSADEEYAFLFENGEWICYDLDTKQPIQIKERIAS